LALPQVVRLSFMSSRSERALLETHVTPVYRFALRLTAGDTHAADDLTQEAMLRACRHLEKLVDPDTTRYWLLRTTTNAWRDMLRRRRTKRNMLARLGPPPPPPDDAPADRERLEAALAALDDLPARQREVLYLRACEDLEPAAIAEILDMTVGAVRSTISLARKRMREKLREPVLEEPTS
jgi:RNA polymerase sigma-70 factor (ECF subfamily)